MGKFKEPPKDIQQQLDGLCSRLNTVLNPMTAEIKGWWIWVEGEATTKEQLKALKDMGLFQAKKGRNAGKWFYKHYMAPNSYRSKRNYSKRGRGKSVVGTGKNPDAEIKANPLTELYGRLERVKASMKIDSGENYINLKKMESDILAEILKIESGSEDRKEESAQSIPIDKDKKDNKEEPMPLQNALDELKKEAQQNQTQEDKIELSEEEVEDILSNLFD